MAWVFFGLANKIHQITIAKFALSVTILKVHFDFGHTLDID